jgi:hypothetical protein
LVFFQFGKNPIKPPGGVPSAAAFIVIKKLGDCVKSIANQFVGSISIINKKNVEVFDN